MRVRSRRVREGESWIRRARPRTGEVWVLLAPFWVLVVLVEGLEGKGEGEEV